MMTPLEIQNQEFSSKFKGYDKEEVRHFLYMLAEEFQSLLEQHREQMQELSVLGARLRDVEERDKILKDTLISAQQIKKEIQENANKEAMLTIREGQLKAEQIFESAKKEVDKVGFQLIELKRQRNDMLAEIEMIVTRFSHFIEVERTQADESDKIHRMLIERQDKKPVITNNQTKAIQR